MAKSVVVAENGLSALRGRGHRRDRYGSGGHGLLLALQLAI